jgi:hypothetical protein
MTVASASIETRVSYQLFQSSVISRSLAPVNEKTLCREEVLGGQRWNATFRRALRSPFG